MVCIMWLIFSMHVFAFWALQVLNLFLDNIHDIFELILRLTGTLFCLLFQDSLHQMELCGV